MDSNEIKKIDISILMKGSQIGCVTFSKPLGKEDGEDIKHMYEIRTLKDLESVILNLRNDAEDFPMGNLDICLDGNSWIQLKNKNVESINKIPDSVYDKYSNEKRDIINITYDKENKIASFDRSIGLDWDDQEVKQIHSVSGLTKLEVELYNNLQTLKQFPRNADFYINGELFASVDRMNKYHLEADEHMDLSIPSDNANTFVLKIKTVKNDDGTISLKNEEPVMLYYDEMCNGFIRNSEGNIKFQSHNEAMKALDGYVKYKDVGVDSRLQNLDLVNLFLDGERIGTYTNGRRLYKSKDLFEGNKNKLKN